MTEACPQQRFVYILRTPNLVEKLTVPGQPSLEFHSHLEEFSLSCDYSVSGGRWMDVCSAGRGEYPLAVRRRWNVCISAKLTQAY